MNMNVSHLRNENNEDKIWFFIGILHIFDWIYCHLNENSNTSPIAIYHVNEKRTISYKLHVRQRYWSENIHKIRFFWLKLSFSISKTREKRLFQASYPESHVATVRHVPFWLFSLVAVI